MKTTFFNQFFTVFLFMILTFLHFSYQQEFETPDGENFTQIGIMLIVGLVFIACGGFFGFLFSLMMCLPCLQHHWIRGIKQEGIVDTYHSENRLEEVTTTDDNGFTSTSTVVRTYHFSKVNWRFGEEIFTKTFSSPIGKGKEKQPIQLVVNPRHPEKADIYEDWMKKYRIATVISPIFGAMAAVGGILLMIAVPTSILSILLLCLVSIPVVLGTIAILLPWWKISRGSASVIFKKEQRNAANQLNNNIVQVPVTVQIIPPNPNSPPFSIV